MQVFWGEARKGTVGVRNCKVDGETGHKIDTHNSLPPQLRWWPMNVNDAGASSVGKKRKQNGHKTLLIKQIKTVLLLAIEAQEGERSNIRKEKKTVASRNLRLPSGQTWGKIWRPAERTITCMYMGTLKTSNAQEFLLGTYFWHRGVYVEHQKRPEGKEKI